MNDNAPDAGILDTLKGYSDRMTISQAVVFFERLGYGVTKTMIQNYVRVGALPPPIEKRRYTKNHLLMILMIDHLKAIYSLEEIRRLFEPVADKFNSGEISGMSDVYRKFCKFYDNKIESLSNAVNSGSDAPFFTGLSIAAESVACRSMAAGIANGSERAN